ARSFRDSQRHSSLLTEEGSGGAILTHPGEIAFDPGRQFCMSVAEVLQGLTRDSAAIEDVSLFGSAAASRLATQPTIKRGRIRYCFMDDLSSDRPALTLMEPQHPKSISANPCAVFVMASRQCFVTLAPASHRAVADA